MLDLIVHVVFAQISNSKELALKLNTLMLPYSRGYCQACLLVKVIFFVNNNTEYFTQIAPRILSKRTQTKQPGTRTT